MHDEIDLGESKMSLYEFARWVSLYEAVDIIANKCEQKGIDFQSDHALKFIKPLDIQDYIDTRTDSVQMMIVKAREFEFKNSALQIKRIKNNIRKFEVDAGLPI
jgi:hypothetical protein